MIATGHAVSSKPVSTSLRPQTDCRKKGKDTIASICAVNEQTDVAIDMENMGIRNKSTGRSG